MAMTQPTFIGNRSSRLTCRETGDSYSFVPNGHGFTVRRNGQKMCDRQTVNGCILAIESDCRWAIRCQMSEIVQADYRRNTQSERNFWAAHPLTS